MSLELYLSSDEKRSLMNSGDDAANSLYGLVLAGALTVEACSGLTNEEVTSLKANLSANKLGIQAQNKPILLALLNECNPTAPIQTAGNPIVTTTPDNYKTGPLKTKVDPNTPFQSVAENQEVKEMARIVKSNINLMQTSVREHWIRHFDDFLLGSNINLFDEYEHFGRLFTDGLGMVSSGIPFVGVTDSSDADNIVSRGQTNAAAVIDSLVAQYGNGKKELNSIGLHSQVRTFASSSDRDAEIKKMLVKMNKSVKAEDDWLMTFGLYLASKVSLPLVGGVLKGILKLASVKGRGGVQLIALGTELYEKVDRRMKGADPANKTLWDSVKDRLKGEKLAGASSADLDFEQKKLRDAQMEGTKGVLRDYLYEKYGGSMTREEFDKAVDGQGSSKKNITDARRTQSEIMTKMSKHLLIDFSSSANDAYEIDQRMRAMALDMEPSVWVKIRTGIYRFFFEKGGITNLVLQNKLVDLSNRVGMGSYSKPVRTHADALRTNLDIVPVDIGGGQTVNVPRVDEERFKKLIKHIDADVAMVAQAEEIKALKEIKRIQGEIDALRATGIPDTEQGVADRIRQLEEANMRYVEFEKLHNLAQRAREEREIADKSVKDEKDKVDQARKELETEKRKVELYRDYYRVQDEYVSIDAETQRAQTSLNQNIQRVADSIRSLEGKVQGKVPFTQFSANLTDQNFLQEARTHVEGVQADIATYNSNALEKVDTGEGTMRVIQSAETSRDTFDSKYKTRNTKKGELDAKIMELTDAGIWDPQTKSATKNLRELQSDVKDAESGLKSTEKLLAEAQERFKKVQAGVSKVKASIGAHPSREVINKGTVRNADGTVVSRDMWTVPDIDAKLVQAQKMAAKLVQMQNAKQIHSAAEQARTTEATRLGVITETKPNLDGTHSGESLRFFNKMQQQKTDVQMSYTEYVNRATAKGYTLEIKDGNATLTDTAGQKLEFDMRDSANRAELFKKIK